MLKDLYIQVLIKEPNKNPVEKRIRNEVERMRKIVGGEFEILEYDEDVFIIYNYESRIKKLADNLELSKQKIKGTIILIGNNSEVGDFRALTNDEIKELKREFSRENYKEFPENEM